MFAGRVIAGLGCLLVAGLMIVGCGPHPEPTSPQPKSARLPGEVTDEASSPWAKCSEMFASSGDPNTDIMSMGRLCGVKNNQRPLTPVRLGQQTEHDAVERFTFTGGGPSKCYRIFAMGETGVRDLDVLVAGPNGELLASDDSKEPYAIVPPREPLCLDKQAIYTVEVSVFRGSGRYALQVWSN